MWKLFITLSSLYALNVVSGFISPAQAATDMIERDFEQPIYIDAHHEFFDLKNNIFKVTGQVVVTQGSLIIHADTLIAEDFGSNTSNAERFLAEGSPATYQQEIEPGVIVTAQAKMITYDATSRILILAGDAELLQSGNFLKASKITYDLAQQTINAERGQDPQQRVRTSLQPRSLSDVKAEKGNQ